LLKTLIILAVIFYAIAVAVMYFAQRRFIYFPDPTRTMPHAAGLSNVVERIIATPTAKRSSPGTARRRSASRRCFTFTETAERLNCVQGASRNISNVGAACS
jgi:hypothetical protein